MNEYFAEQNYDVAALSKFENNTSNDANQSIIDQLEPYVLNYDNEKKLTNHAWIDVADNSTGYFADPFAIWHRGSNKHPNRLISSKRAPSTVTDNGLKMIESAFKIKGPADHKKPS